jgi:hypothetical protein
VTDKHPLPFQGAPPDRNTCVLAQAIRFSPEQWRDALPDPALWPPELEAAPKSDGEGHHLVERRIVLQIGERATEPLGAVHTLVAADVWGTGTSARGRRRRLWVFDQGVDAVGNLLASAAQRLHADGPLAAYAYLHGNGNIIKHLGASFGTKFLYFSGYGRCCGGQQPLILDDNVAAALDRLCGLTSPQYAEYLDLAHAWAREWQTSPDVIERVLFSVGKTERLVISAFTGLPLDG